jgi:hypothetical protein
VLLAGIALPPIAHAADATAVHAVLIIASKEKAPADPRLARYEATLQRNLPESSFRFVSEGSASVPNNGPVTSLSLGTGHRLQLKSSGKDNDGIRLKIEWRNGKAVVMDNAFTLQPSVPVVLGSRPSGDGNVPIVIVTAR